jgi:hypothetical protein
MGNSDIKMADRRIVVEAWDLCLDSKDRRKNETLYRRALVHDYGDRLTINWGGDYPEGVKIQGDTTIEGNLKINNGVMHAKVGALYGWEFIGGPSSIHLVAEDLVLNNKQLDESKRNVALSHGANDTLIINKDEGYEGGVHIEGNLKINKSLLVDNMDLIEEIRELKNEIFKLKDQIKKYVS